MKQNKKGQLIFRNEWKHSMDHTDYIIIRSRLASIADESMYAGLGGSYRVRSLTFTEPEGELKTDFLAPIGKKESFRIRYYNENTDYIRLEKKTRISGKTNKQSAPLSVEECRRILTGDLEWMAESEEPLLEELYISLASGRLIPLGVADYQREAFVYRPCNVRITMDSELKTGIAPKRFLELRGEGAFEAAAGGGAAGEGIARKKEAVIMKVKYDCFLPEVIRAAIRIKTPRASSFSRYETRHAFSQI